MQQIQRRRAIEAQRLIAVTAAGIMGVAGGDQCGPAVPGVGDQGLAVVGAEVDQVQIAAQGDLACTHRVGQPAALAAVAHIPAAQAPESGPQRVGGGQLVQRRHHYVHPGLLQGVELAVFQAAIQSIEGVGDQYHVHAGVGLPGLDQRGGQFGGQWPVALLTGELVEQEHVDHHQASGLLDDRQSLIEYLLLADALAVGILPGLIQQQLHILRRTPGQTGGQARGQGTLGLEQRQAEPDHE